MGTLGIGVIGYNFSYANVWGRVSTTRARGGATSPGYSHALAPDQAEIPNGMVWNTIYDPDAPEGSIGTVTEAMIWDRFERFLRELVPVAEEAGVRLAMHPADPPLETINGTFRLITKPEHYQRLLDLVPSHCNAAEFCQGTIAEMDGDMDVYEGSRPTPARVRLPTCTCATWSAKCRITMRLSSTMATSIWRARYAFTTSTASTASSSPTTARLWHATLPGTPAWPTLWAGCVASFPPSRRGADLDQFAHGNASTMGALPIEMLESRELLRPWTKTTSDCPDCSRIMSPNAGT